MPVKFQVLKNVTAFPSFDTLPDFDDLDTRYYPEWGGTPKRHWCFLGEITQVEKFLRTSVFARDRKGKVNRIAFYPEKEDDEEKMKALEGELKVGHTIAVMYAFSKEFMDGSCGIRAEDGLSIKVIPMALSDILALPVTLSPQAQETNLVTCATCGKSKQKDHVEPKKCSRCKMYAYCDQDCQKQGWIDGHKNQCRGLAIVASMCDRNWNRWEMNFGFYEDQWVIKIA